MSNMIETDPRPYDPEAKKECIFLGDAFADHFGKYPCDLYPKKEKKIFDSILEGIGSTPLVKLNRIPKEYKLECNVYGKCEFLNAGGSVKDRVALKMVENAEKTGRLRPGMTVIEPTSGNTGIGLALVCAVKGYRCIIVMPEKMSKEKEITLKALGAEIVRTPDSEPYDSEKSHLGTAFRLRRETPNSVVLDQYLNCSNPMAHFESTAEEILDSLDGKVDMVVVGTGTGGTITGIAKKMQQKSPGCKIVGVDPIGSVLSGSNCKNNDHNFQVEGIGYDFMPTTLDMDLIDHWEKLGDLETFQMAKKIIRDEGILSGGSAGAILAGAMRAAKELKKGQNCVVLLPDSIRNYLSKFLNDEWMVSNKFMNPLKPPQSIHPKNTFDTMAEYDPEAPPIYDFQKVNEPWFQKTFNPKKPLLINTIDEAIGKTPLVRLRKIPQELGIEAEILKCEYLNAGGSIKDRIARKMIELAEKTGALKPGMTIIEPTSGNTGIGLAMIAAIRGYRCIIVMPEKMSKEKEVTLKALGAEIVRSPSHHHYSHPDSHIGVALRLQKEIPGSIILDQYRNVGNPLAHYEDTAEEILYACDNKIDAIVVGVGTGGSISGIAKKILEKVPTCQIIGTDPEGSLLADPTQNNTHSYEVEGTGYDFVPAVLDRSLVSEWIKTNDNDSFITARKLIREGFLCGGSSGSNVWATLQIAKRFKKGDRIVVILPDGIRNYMSKFLDDDWMLSKGFSLE